ncbi:hypothetical protein IV38_GL001367 [Lactobacillus selangorensis]|uniref:DUF2922 domain-containing protein n=1 Tax=Lactobacillus selangorensis TaxID=81857 RepID=A0A0R2FIK0_9LACO|nr:DUF2922 domain-containing protein [Lactobacillus selangorensis]KRN28368.1 hypothetical protein IV38_GL001367 [Lactobacillus selangorensis]KRN31869.1 hypothetical protein IV40_GL001154 [Lactobacillus selangorensis]
MKQLQMAFKNEAGRKTTLKLNLVKEDLDETATRAAMDKIVAAKLFERDGKQLYHEAAGAKYVETNEQIIF